MPGRARLMRGRSVQPFAPDDSEPVSGAGDGASGASSSDAQDPKVLVGNLDDAIDSAYTVVNGLDLSDAAAEVQQFAANVTTAAVMCDLLSAALGVKDDDTLASPNGDSAADPVALAQAVDAAIDAANTSISGVDSTPDGFQPAIDAMKGADEISDDLLAALGSSDPDDDGEDEGEDDAAPADAPPAPKPPAPPKAAASARQARYAAAAAAAPPPTDAPDLGDSAAPAGDLPGLKFPVMVLEGINTGDGREIVPNCLTWRDLPIPVMVLTETNDFGHVGAQLCGRIDSIERVDYSKEINPKTGEAYGTYEDGSPVMALVGQGVFNTGEISAQVADDIKGKFLRGVSVDIFDVESEIVMLDEDGNPLPEPDGGDEDDLLDMLFFGGNMKEVVTAGRIAGATICPFPAFEGAYVELDDGTTTEAVAASGRPRRLTAFRAIDTFGERTCEPCAEGGAPLVASAGPIAPPKAWFSDPGLKALTPLTITDDGRVFGHLAPWGACHTGYGNRCVTPPRDPDGTYSYFKTGALKTAEGDVVPVGNLTMDTGHAATSGTQTSAMAALAHYDNTSAVFADVSMGEDKYGIWFSGAMRPDLTEEQVRRARAGSLSGDWRSIGGRLRLVAALAVNSPGYPIVRAHTASGVTTALVAAGAPEMMRLKRAAEIPSQWSEFATTVARKAVEEMQERQRKAAALRRRVHGKK